MRIVALLIVFVVGALLFLANSLVEDRRGRLDDFGVVVMFAGLIALGVELYLLPFFRRRRE